MIYILIGFSIILFVILVYVLFIKKNNFQVHNQEISIKQGVFFVTFMSTLIVSIILIEYEIPIFIYLLIWWFALALPNIYIYHYFRNCIK